MLFSRPVAVSRLWRDFYLRIIFVAIGLQKWIIRELFINKIESATFGSEKWVQWIEQVSRPIKRNNQTQIMADSNVMSWNVQKVLRVSKDTVNERILDLIRQEQIDGNCILLITESDCLSLRDKYNLKLGELKRFQLFVHQVQERNQLNSFPGTNQAVLPGFNTHHQLISNFILNSANNQQRHYGDSELNFHDLSPPHSIDG